MKKTLLLIWVVFGAFFVSQIYATPPLEPPLMLYEFLIEKSENIGIEDEEITITFDESTYHNGITNAVINYSYTYLNTSNQDIETYLVLKFETLLNKKYTDRISLSVNDDVIMYQLYKNDSESKLNAWMQDQTQTFDEIFTTDLMVTDLDIYPSTSTYAASLYVVSKVLFKVGSNTLNFEGYAPLRDDETYYQDNCPSFSYDAYNRNILMQEKADVKISIQYSEKKQYYVVNTYQTYQTVDFGYVFVLEAHEYLTVTLSVHKNPLKVIHPLTIIFYGILSVIFIGMITGVLIIVIRSGKK